MRYVMASPVPAFWTQRQDIGPKGRSQHALTFDPKRERTVLFGGSVFPYNTANNFRDTWEWDGLFWVQVANFGPPALGAPNMAYDAKRERVVLLGSGLGGRTTWEWDGASWTQVDDQGPPAFHSAMVYDADHECIVVFGGLGKVEDSAGTWRWNGIEWTQISEVGPSARQLHAMAYDTNRKRAVLFGGWSGGSLLGDTWEWNGAVWEQIATFGPSPRVGHAMAFDAERGLVVLFGGSDTLSGGAAVSARQDTWEWDGKHWRQGQDMGPDSRIFSAMVFDESRKRVVLFGGSSNEVPTASDFGDTWELSQLRLVPS